MVFSLPLVNSSSCLEGAKKLLQSRDKMLLRKQEFGILPMRPTLHVRSFIFLDKFLQSRRQGSSVRTIEFYECCLKPFVLSYELTSDGINQFLRSLTCGNGKHGYYRAIRAFYNWLYRNGYVKSNPIENVDPPKQSRKLLPCLNEDEVEYLIEQAGNIRDMAIISLSVDSGIRLNDLVNPPDFAPKRASNSQTGRLQNSDTF